MFVGKDVATALGYSNVRDALSKHVDSEDKGVAKCDTLGGAQKITLINESGLYSLILSSKLPQAKAFKRWVTSEVLPQIRKTGGYIPTKDANGRQLSNEEIINRADAIVGRTLQMLNEPAEDTLTATQVAKTFNMTVFDFNAVLRDMGIQYRRGGHWNICRIHVTMKTSEKTSEKTSDIERTDRLYEETCGDLSGNRISHR